MEATRQQRTRALASTRQYGAIQSVEFRGVDNQGTDVYDVRHENGAATFRIRLSSDGKRIESAFSDSVIAKLSKRSAYES